MNILRAIQKVHPNWQGIVWENDYNRITPSELETRHVPSLAELEAAWTEIQIEEMRVTVINAIQSILDTKAKELGFDTVHTAAVWTISKNPARKARADALVAWGDQWWDYAEAEWAKQVTGESTFTTVDEFLAAGPKFNEGL